MKTLVIIDDELFFRRSLLDFLGKQEYYKVIGEANNGQAGIDLIQKTSPDIALVDISMPVMGGLEMIRALSHTCRTKFIIFTGYEDFQYAKQAISLGVNEYLLKPLDRRELLNCLEKVSREIDDEQTREAYLPKYLKTRRLYLQHVALTFFYKIIAGNTQPEELPVLKEELSMDESACYTVLLLKLNGADSSVWDMDADLSLLHSVIENIFMEIFSPHYQTLMYVDFSSLHQYAVIGTESADFDFVCFRELSLQLIQVLAQTVRITVTAFSGTPHKGIRGIRLSYEETLSSLYNSAALPVSATGKFYRFEENPFAEKHDLYEKIPVLLRQKKETEILDCLSRYFETTRTQNLHIRQIWIAASTFLAILANHISESGGQISDFPSLQNAFEEYQNQKSGKQLEKLIIQTYRSVLNRLRENSETQISSLVARVQKYISENYARPELRLESIATHFYVNPQYLSGLFSRETGMTLTGWINTCRMQKAKELLLSESPSVTNIAYLCGFTDPGYFSKCFRKYYGISPRNFLAMTEQQQSESL